MFDDFDYSKVYTAVNADKLKIGSRVIFADTLYDLMYKVCDPNFDDFSILEKVTSPEFKSRFIGYTKTSVCTTNAYLLAYLVEEAPAKIKKCYSIVKCRKCENPIAKEILFYTNDIFISKDRAIEYCEKLNKDVTREQGTFFDAVVADLFTEE